jgi:hypothetical protein
VNDNNTDEEVKNNNDDDVIYIHKDGENEVVDEDDVMKMMTMMN